MFLCGVESNGGLLSGGEGNDFCLAESAYELEGRAGCAVAAKPVLSAELAGVVLADGPDAAVLVEERGVVVPGVGGDDFPIADAVGDAGEGRSCTLDSVVIGSAELTIVIEACRPDVPVFIDGVGVISACADGDDLDTADAVRDLLEGVDAKLLVISGVTELTVGIVAR